jgi:hypothetical protein
MFRLPFLFIATGIISFAVYQVLCLADLASWINLQPRNPIGWSRIHLLVLGWATMIAMGAVYQLINVVLQSKIYSEKLGFVHYGFFLVGTTGLLYGFQSMNLTWIACFASIAFIGILLFAWNMTASLLRAKQWSPVTISVGCAVAYLTCTGIMGMAMGLNFRFNQWGSFHEQLLGAHIWFGAVGWFGLLITGISYKMLPMFYLSHGFPIHLQKVTLLLWNAGVLAGACSFLLKGPLWPGLLFIVMALLFYNIHIQQIFKFRHKSKPGAGIIWAIWAARVLGLTGILALLLLALFPKVNHSGGIVVVGWAYMWGWVALTILAYLSKIAPFLWWTHKYGPRVGKGLIPTMSDLIQDRLVHIGLTFISLSMIVLLIGLSSDLNWLISIGGTALSLGSLAYISLIALVFTK